MRGILLALALVAASMAAAPTAGAQLLEPYDGSNPFDCTLQDVGFGVDFPDPGADPFCVEFDKTRQNITELGIVDFLAQEPARVAAAGLKCFYYQHDHWTSSIVQDNAATELYNWDGSYFFDKARGTGGVYIENFTLNNQTFDPRLIPGFPEEWKPYFGPGRGGVQVAASGVEFQPDSWSSPSARACTRSGPAAGALRRARWAASPATARSPAAAGRATGLAALARARNARAAHAALSRAAPLVHRGRWRAGGGVRALPPAAGALHKPGLRSGRRGLG